MGRFTRTLGLGMESEAVASAHAMNRYLGPPVPLKPSRQEEGESQGAVVEVGETPRFSNVLQCSIWLEAVFLCARFWTFREYEKTEDQLGLVVQWLRGSFLLVNRKSAP